MSSVRLTSQQRRDCILETAIQLFAEKGFRGVTTKELASCVGVSEPILYQHFNTKRDLYRAILERMVCSADTAVPELASFRLPPAGTDREFLTNLARGMVSWHQKNPNFVRLLMLSTLEGHEFHSELHERYARVFFNHLRDYFSKRMDEGVYRRMDPSLPTTTYLSFVGHYALELTLFKKNLSSMSPESTIEGFIDIFMEGIRA